MIKDQCPLPREFPGLYGPGLGKGANGKIWVALATRLSSDIGLSSSGPITQRRSHRGLAQCELDNKQSQRPGWSDPHLLKLATETWNLTSLVEKEPELGGRLRGTV